MKLLLSATDSGTAAHFIPLIQNLECDDRFELTVIAQSPAYNIFRKADISAIFFKQKVIDSKNDLKVSGLIEQASNILIKYSPDALLCGSTALNRLGISEVLLKQVRTTSFLFQDYCGYINNFFEVKPNHVFVVDQKAFNLTLSEHGIRSKIVGSPRHEKMKHINHEYRKKYLRNSLNLDQSALVITFCAQALNNIEGYEQALETWLSLANDQFMLAYKPHPREMSDHKKSMWNSLKKIYKSIINLQDFSIEDVLLLSDIVCSPFSSCLYDAAYMNKFSSVPLSTPIAMFFHPQIKQYFANALGTQEPLFFDRNYIFIPDNQNRFIDTVHKAIDIKHKHEYWLQTKHYLPNIQNSFDKIKEEIIKSAKV